MSSEHYKSIYSLFQRDVFIVLFLSPFGEISSYNIIAMMSKI